MIDGPRPNRKRGDQDREQVEHDDVGQVEGVAAEQRDAGAADQQRQRKAGHEAYEAVRLIDIALVERSSAASSCCRSFGASDAFRQALERAEALPRTSSARSNQPGRIRAS